MEKRMDVIWKGRSLVEKITVVIGVFATIFHLYFAIAGTAEPLWYRATHLSFLLPIAFLIYPSRNSKWFFVDVILFLLSFLSLYYLWGYEYARILDRYVRMDPVYTMDVVMGLLFIFLLIEATRRVLGWPLTILSALAVGYLFVGHLLPGNLQTQSFSVERIVEQMYMTSNGVFGIALSASASFIFLFILFGALLQQSGTGQTLIDLVKGLVGHKKGGPAKIAVLSSASMGTLSGSPTANVATTGTLTIPMMQKNGYGKNYSAAVEASASTGGQIMPPVMGSVAFVLAEFVGIPYLEVVKAALLPAFLYFLAILIMVHLQAQKKNIGGIEKSLLPNVVQTFKLNWHQLVPIAVLVYFLMAGYTAYYAAAFSIFSIPVISWVRKHTRMTIKHLIKAMEEGTKAAILVAIATAAAGLIIGSVNMSGLAVKVTGVITSLSATSIILSLLLTMIATIILGMGIPTTAAYITSTAITVPPLVMLGIDVFSAHMFVLYFACLSSITPPVAIASYAAAGINGASALKTAFLSCRIGIVAFIVPYIFVFSNALFLQGSFVEIGYAVVTGIIGVTILAAGFEGYLLRELKLPIRIACIGLGIMALTPHIAVSTIAVLVTLFLIVQQYVSKQSGTTATNQGVFIKRRV
ncbi:TRAP transporter permease [Evansella sp. LMS18]|uniref:TRAP transporter permease n=1 Tax=Evansella sp. LMS18 TaxID=2924033 RepID=UPI0020D1B2CF|nr:TRAP transporter permease [Evansella sp. LMS18]UTR12061.1 TRAP transporter permease [Evansella sp. LMS18]